MYRMKKDEFERLRQQVEADVGDFEVDMSSRAAMTASIKRIFGALTQHGLAAVVGHEQNGEPLYQLTDQGKAYMTWLQASGDVTLFPGSATKGSA